MKWGIFRKNDWKCLVAFETKRQAKKCIKGKERVCEIRRIKS